jgi:hypothetical protein
MQSSSDE